MKDKQTAKEKRYKNFLVMSLSFILGYFAGFQCNGEFSSLIFLLILLLLGYCVKLRRLELDKIVRD